MLWKLLLLCTMLLLGSILIPSHPTFSPGASQPPLCITMPPLDKKPSHAKSIRHVWVGKGRREGLQISLWHGACFNLKAALCFAPPLNLALSSSTSPHQHLSGPQTPSVLWNAMIHPLLNMTLRGVAWYQGEPPLSIRWDGAAPTVPASSHQPFFLGDR